MTREFISLTQLFRYLLNDRHMQAADFQNMCHIGTFCGQRIAHCESTEVYVRCVNMYKGDRKSVV